MSCIDSSGQMINVPPEICGLYPKEAREKTLALLEKEGKVIKTEPLKHSVGICYRCKNTIEPLLSPQWYIKILPLAKPAIEAVEKNQVKFFPPRFKKIFLDWMRQIRDWNISRQVVWGPRIPAWYCLDCSPKIKINFLGKNNNAVSGLYEELKEKYPFEEIKNGLQTLSAPVESEFLVAENGTCPHCQGSHLLQETDTFDTWFSSGQWPLTTLGYPEAEDFKYFYPTSVLDTMWDILFFWVARMIMFGLYLAKDVPFRVVHMHSRVLDPKRQKMSKSKGNVIDPIDMAEKYGADALRMVLVFGTAPASDIVVSEEKIKAMRNFANKIWNIGRYLVGHLEKKGLFRYEDLTEYQPEMAGLKETDRQIIKELNEVISGVTQSIEKYHFGLASEQIYEFLWHRLADWYIEETKERVKAGEATPLSVLRHVYLNCLKLLHPFMPFVTETIWQEFPRKDQSPLIVAPWPKA
jgi:valyl-tRNA synthetase